MSEPNRIVDSGSTDPPDVHEGDASVFTVLALAAQALRGSDKFWFSLVEHPAFDDAARCAARRECGKYGKRNDVELLNDVVQSIILKVLAKYAGRDASPIDWEKNPAAWFRQLLGHRALDFLRARDGLRLRERSNSKLGNSDDERLTAATDDEGESRVLLQELRAAVIEALSKLPLRDEKIMRLHYFDQLKQFEIADRVGCDVGHVSRIIATTHAKLRRHLKEMGYDK